MKKIRSVKVALPRTAVAGVLAALAMLLLAGPANAQSVTDQYIPSASPEGTQNSGTGAQSPGGAPAGAGAPSANPVAERKTGDGGGADVPFTDYPLTPLVDLILLLAIGGLVLRLVVPRLDRRHT